MTGTGERPEKHNHRKTATRSQYVDQLTAARIHQRVREQERGLQGGELTVAERNVATDCFDRDRQRLSIEIADCDRSADEDGDSPPQTVFLQFPTVPSRDELCIIRREEGKRLLNLFVRLQSLRPSGDGSVKHDESAVESPGGLERAGGGVHGDDYPSEASGCVGIRACDGAAG